MYKEVERCNVTEVQTYSTSVGNNKELSMVLLCVVVTWLQRAPVGSGAETPTSFFLVFLSQLALAANRG